MSSLHCSAAMRLPRGHPISFSRNDCLWSRNRLVLDAISSSFVYKDRDNFTSFPRTLFNMSNPASTQSAARVTLAGLPAAANRVNGSALPHPLFDPFPDMSLALFTLWHAMIPFVGFTATGAPMFVRPGQQPNISVGQAFALFGPLLVSP